MITLLIALIAVIGCALTTYTMRLKLNSATAELDKAREELRRQSRDASIQRMEHELNMPDGGVIDSTPRRPAPAHHRGHTQNERQKLIDRAGREILAAANTTLRSENEDLRKRLERARELWRHQVGLGRDRDLAEPASRHNISVVHRPDGTIRLTYEEPELYRSTTLSFPAEHRWVPDALLAALTNPVVRRRLGL